MMGNLEVEAQEIVNELLHQIAELVEKNALLNVINRKLTEENKQLKEQLPKEDTDK